jgi:phospholipid/cholesterol/gamma-HCH transport system substrate-binding protein
MGILRSHKLIGLVFLTLMAASIWFTYAIFTKKFADYEEVKLQTSKIGLQMPTRADIKIRGVIIGEVLEFDTTAEGAVLTLGIYPDELDTISKDVTGSIVPKTLFGEKYVALEVPENATREHIRAGDTIPRTDVSIEVEKVLSDLYPLLNTVQPAQLNFTLNALATALEGRGDKIGENLETLDAYLKRINPQIPLLVDDLRKTAQVSDLYTEVLPEIATILQNTVATGHTVEGREEKLKALFNDVAQFSDTATAFLDRNDDNLIRLGDLSATQFRMLAKYAPEYPCLLGGIVNAGKDQAEAFRGFILHINLELLPNQPRGWNRGDAPVNGDKRGPYCGALPDPPWDQQRVFRNVPNLNDGVEQPTGKGTRRVAPGGQSRGYAGSAAEAQMLNTLLATTLGVPAEDVPDLGALLIGPMARGAEVSLR